jgi:hypothetical protein
MRPVNDMIFQQASPSPQAFGIICDFVAKYPPFDGFEFGVMAKTLRFQLEQQTHMLGLIEGRIEAYVGWIPTSRAIAEAWASGDGPLNPEPSADAIAVTILATSSRDYILPLIKASKKFNLTKSVFWKRSFQDGRTDQKRTVRKRDDR